MANYYTHFSLILKLPTEAAQKFALDLAGQARSIRHNDEEPPGTFPKSLRDAVEDWQFDTDASDSSNGWGLWIHSGDGGVDAVCAFIQHLLERFDPEGHVSLEWSNDCSQPRVDAFGGGAVLITARKIKSISTGEWLQKRLAIIQARKPQRQQSKPLNTN